MEGNTNRSRKRYARLLGQEAGHSLFIYDTARPSKRARNDEEEPIIFNPDDGYTSQPHSDPLVVTMGIANCDINRVLID